MSKLVLMICAALVIGASTSSSAFAQGKKCKAGYVYDTATKMCVPRRGSYF